MDDEQIEHVADWTRRVALGVLLIFVAQKVAGVVFFLLVLLSVGQELHWYVIDGLRKQADLLDALNARLMRLLDRHDHKSDLTDKIMQKINDLTEEKPNAQY